MPKVHTYVVFFLGHIYLKVSKVRIIIIIVGIWVDQMTARPCESKSLDGLGSKVKGLARDWKSKILTLKSRKFGKRRF